MLVRMYLRWAEREGYSSTMMNSLPGEEAGLKSAKGGDDRKNQVFGQILIILNFAVAVVRVRGLGEHGVRIIVLVIDKIARKILHPEGV